MKNTSKKWFKPKPFNHFSSKIFSEDYSWVLEYVSDKAKISSHPFLPLIHKVLAQRKFRRNRKTNDGKRIKGDIKLRHIFYATHMDSHIYAYYAKILGEKYEAFLKEDPELSKCILAYRSVPKEGSRKNKSNVDFAYEVFSHIKNLSSDCVALAFDIKSFFDELDHKILKENWAKLMDSANLPDDHFHVFRSLINYKYIEEDDLLKFQKLKHANDLKKLKTKKFFKSETFRDFIAQDGIIKKNDRKNSIGKLIGIPQGTALSAFLSNLYMYFFDMDVFKYVSTERNGLYRRYSDDIVIVVDPKYAEEIKSFMYKKIEDFKLIIQPEKTEVVNFKKEEEFFSCDKPLNYLGFQFNGKKILLKPSSLGKYYRSLKMAIKVLAKRASKRRSTRDKKIFRKNVYRFSHLARRNYYNYALRASDLMDSDQEYAIKRQLKNHWKVIQREIKKREGKIVVSKAKRPT